MVRSPTVHGSRSMTFTPVDKSNKPPITWPVEYTYYDETLEHSVTRYKPAYATTEDLPLEELPK